MNYQMKSLNDALGRWANETPNKVAYTFLVDGENQEEKITYQALEEKVKAVAATLQLLGKQGDRVMLLCPSSIDFITSFFGCLYAGMIAVPVYHKVKQNPNRFLNILNDANPSVILGHKQIINEAKAILGEANQKLKWQNIELIQSNRARFYRTFAAELNTTAFLQYTSGSTSDPKGVIVSHENLLYNFEIIAASSDSHQLTNFFTWLPLYHDMGLIGNALFSTFLGAHLVFMTPTSFIKKPVRWLKAISKYKVQISGAPNFAYDLVPRKVIPSDLEGLDLSSWEVAFCGAEPIRYETLRNFAAKLGNYGFNFNALFPCYGLAEATLMVTASGKGNGIKRVFVDKDKMDKSEAYFVSKNAANSKVFVASGKKVLEQEIRIVHPETCLELEEGQVGEVWVAGKHIAKGYWNKPEVSKQRLQAQLEGEEFDYLRTGDLGFKKKGQLYITGRIKDLIKIRGRGIYPQDLEFAIDDLSEQFAEIRKGGAGAFAVEQNGKEGIATFIEIKPRNNKDHCPEKLSKAIIKAIAEQFDVVLADVVFIKSGTLPKTTSGKIKRHACSELYKNNFKNYFVPIFQLSANVNTGIEETTDNIPGAANGICVTFKSGNLKTKRNQSNLNFELSLSGVQPASNVLHHNKTVQSDEIQRWLAEWLSNKLKISLAQIDPKESLMCYGLDSIDAIELVDTIEKKMKVSISSTVLHDLDTLAAIADYLKKERQVEAVA